MQSQRVDRYWSERFGLEPRALSQAGVFIVPHARPWPDSFACVFVRDRTGVISVGPTLVDAIQDRIQQKEPQALLSEKALCDLFARPLHHTVGPLYQGYAEREDFQPAPAFSARPLQTSERQALRQLQNAVAPTEWEQSGIDRADSELFGLFLGKDLAAVAHYSLWAADAASIGVLTHPAHRGQNHGKVVVSAAMQDAFARGYWVLYQALVANRPSVAVAEALGCRAYAHTMGVYLREG